jgi:hypothetical protein
LLQGQPYCGQPSRFLTLRLAGQFSPQHGRGLRSRPFPLGRLFFGQLTRLDHKRHCCAVWEEDRMRKLLVLLAGVTMAVASLSTAKGETRTAKSGRPSVIWTWFDCRLGDRQVVGSGQAANGTVSVRETTINRCRRSDQPALEATYTSKPDFSGTDTVHLTFGRDRQQITVHVRAD